MDGQHDPQLPVVSAPPPLAAPIIQPAPAPAAPSGRRPGRFLVLRRALRLMFRRWLYAMTLLFRWMRPFAGFVAVIVVLLGVAGWMAAQLWLPAASSGADVRVAPIVPAAAVEHYIQGQQTFNADLMWESLSSEAQAARLENGISKDMMQFQANRDRQRGVQFLRYDYIGGVKLKDGGSMYFYAVDLDSPQRSGKLPFTFLADSEGKVRGLIAPEY
jgi:hypothetical protein